MGKEDREYSNQEIPQVSVIAFRTCPICRKKHSQKVCEQISEADLMHTDAMLVGKWLYPIPKLTCCDGAIEATHAKLVWTIPQPGESVPFRIGSKDIPAVSEKTSLYGEIISPRRLAELQNLWIAQECLWLEQKEDYVKHSLAFFHACWPQPAKEMDPWQLVDLLDELNMLPEDLKNLTRDKSVRTRPRGDKKRYMVVKRIKEYVIREFPKSQLDLFFYHTVDRIIYFSLLPGIYSGKWDVFTHEKSLGQTLLSFLLLTFPLIDPLRYLRTEATVALLSGAEGNHESELRRYVKLVKKQLGEKEASLQRVTVELQQTRERTALLERKLYEAKEEVRKLQEQLVALRKEVSETDYIRKIKNLKGLIDDLQSEINRYQTEQKKNSLANSASNLLVNRSDELSDVMYMGQRRAEQPLQIDVLKGKTVGIFGAVRDHGEREKLPIRILCQDGEKQAECKRILPQCDAIVVLTQHIAHGTMWMIKEYAAMTSKPLIFSRHTSIPLILQQLSQVLPRENANTLFSPEDRG
ncbi:hypothetical protein H1S01_11545 [Heliobacterium chlorum]|uniref:DUF2325 domain-containing protein n=1 Tax=Heliobacterium chlorum TaxID=2698 RepID=A0ABR7T4K4_HELCL|nr:hypothetical protein [Heliobacterium chlorum]MBC9785142.1 hypothetical protein [Heliobacterium chlorum]